MATITEAPENYRHKSTLEKYQDSIMALNKLKKEHAELLADIAEKGFTVHQGKIETEKETLIRKVTPLYNILVGYLDIDFKELNAMSIQDLKDLQSAKEAIDKLYPLPF